MQETSDEYFFQNLQIIYKFHEFLYKITLTSTNHRLNKSTKGPKIKETIAIYLKILAFELIFHKFSNVYKKISAAKL